MRILKYVLLLVVFSPLAHAGDNPVDINCRNQAIELATRIRQDVVTDLDRDQANSIIQLSTRLCKQAFAKQAESQPEPVVSRTENKKAEDGESRDWFTEHVLTGEPADKDGNKRLKRMQNK